MIDNDVIKARFTALEDVSLVKVEGDGYHYQLTVVSDVFIGKGKVARQQWVYAQLKDVIASGELHALTINTWSTHEWESQHG